MTATTTHAHRYALPYTPDAPGLYVGVCTVCGATKEHRPYEAESQAYRSRALRAKASGDKGWAMKKESTR